MVSLCCDTQDPKGMPNQVDVIGESREKSKTGLSSSASNAEIA